MSELTDELEKARRHFDAVASRVAELPESPILVQFCERIDALVDEFAWELGTQS